MPHDSSLSPRLKWWCSFSPLEEEGGKKGAPVGVGVSRGVPTAGVEDGDCDGDALRPGVAGCSEYWSKCS